MNKRLAKRHKRQVARGRANTPVTEPESRTQEQIQAAREVGRNAIGRGGGVSAFGSPTGLRQV